MKKEPDFSKEYTLNVFEVKRIRIGSQFMFHLDVQHLKVMLNLSQTPLSWPTSNIYQNIHCFSRLASSLKASTKLVAANLIATIYLPREQVKYLI